MAQDTVQHLAEQLAACVSAERVLRDPDSLAHWGRDWTRSFPVAPSAIVFPESIDEVIELVRYARRSGVALVPSGGRTGLSGGAVAGAGEVVVSFDRMNRILGFEPADRLVTCQAGVVTGALQQFAASAGLFYPVDFASAGSSQIGGNIATNAGGIKVIRYGMTREWIVGLRVVTGAGELLDCNRGLVKNATGVDFRHLFIGSEGTLGFIVEADVRLLSPPEPQRVMVLGVPRFRDILTVLGHFQQHLTLSAFEFFSELALTKVTAHRKLPRPLAQAAPFYALLEYDARMDAAALACFERCIVEGLVTDGVQSQSEAQAAQLWQLREGISESIAASQPYKNDLSVRVSRMPAFLDDIDALVASRYPDFEICWYGHIGDGNLHLNILKPSHLSQAEFFDRCHHISPDIFARVAALNGSISAEHGVGLLKRDFLGYARSPAEIALLRALKSVLDPSGIMNPGKLLPAG